MENHKNEEDSDFSIACVVEVKFKKGQGATGQPVRITNDPDAVPVVLSEEQIIEKYPFDYAALTKKCKERYIDFKRNKKFYDLNRQFKENEKYAKTRYLDQKNPSSAQKTYYNGNVFQILDRHYGKR